MLAFTSPDIISTSPKSFLMSRIDFTVLLLFEFLQKHHFPSPKSWIIRARRQKETGNQPRLQTLNLNIILTCNIYKELSVTKWNYSHFIHNLPVTQEIRYSFKFHCVGPACYWHDALWPLLRIAWLLPASGPVEQSSVEVTSKFCPSHL